VATDGQRTTRGGGGALDRLIDRGLERYARGDLDGALGEWRGVLDLDPQNRRADSYVRYLEEHYESLAARFAGGAAPRVPRAPRADDPDDGSSVLTLEAEAPEVPEYEELELELGPAGGATGAAIELPSPRELAMEQVDAGWSLEDGWAFDAQITAMRPGAARPIQQVAGDEPRVSPGPPPRGGARPGAAALAHDDAPARGLRGRPTSRGEETIERFPTVPSESGIPVTFDLSELEGGRAESEDGETTNSPFEQVPRRRRRSTGARTTVTPTGDDEQTVDRDRAWRKPMRPDTDGPEFGEDTAGGVRPRGQTTAGGGTNGGDAPTRSYHRAGIEAIAADAPGPGQRGAAARLRGELVTELNASASDGVDDDALRARLGWLLDRAREASERGQHAVAVTAVDLMLDEQPDSALAQKTLQGHREVVSQIYRDFIGDLEAVPSSIVGMRELATTGIDHRTAFLLSRIDGSLSYEELLDVAGMPRLEAYRHLAKLLLDGIIR
jgi:hypothetical protein